MALPLEGQVVWRKERVWREPALILLRLWGSWGLGTHTTRDPRLTAQQAGDTGLLLKRAGDAGVLLCFLWPFYGENVK